MEGEPESSAKENHRDDQQPERFPISDLSQSKDFGHGDVPQPHEHGAQYKQHDYLEKQTSGGSPEA